MFYKLLPLLLLTLAVASCKTMNADLLKTSLTDGDIVSKYGRYADFRAGQLDRLKLREIIDIITYNITYNRPGTDEEKAAQINQVKQTFTYQPNQFYYFSIDTNQRVTDEDANITLALTSLKNTLLGEEYDETVTYFTLINDTRATSHVYYYIFRLNQPVDDKTNDTIKIHVQFPNAKEQVYGLYN